MTESLADRTYAAARRMAEQAGLPAPSRDDYKHHEAAPQTPAPEGQPPPQGTSPADPPAPGTTNADTPWDASAFANLPPDVRAQAELAAAGTLGRLALATAAERLMARPEDVHLHITDPTKYVDKDGRVDRDAVARDVSALVDSRPELGRGFGLSRHAASPHAGAGDAPDHGSAAAVNRALARMQDGAGLKQSPAQ